MIDYKNLSGQSNVAKFVAGEKSIIIEFKTAGKDGCSVYDYTYNSAGQERVEQMKTLANQGFGLNSYINREVKTLYESKRIKSN